MASVGKIRARILQLGNSEDSGVSYDFVAHADSYTFTSSTGMDDVTENDSAAGFKEKLPNDTEWSVSGELYVLFDTEADKDQAFDLMTYHLNKTKVDLKLTDGVTGDKEITGSGYYNQLTITGSTSDYIKASFEITGTGAYTIATIA